MSQGATRLPSAAKIVDLAQEVLRILCNPFDRFSGSHAGSMPKNKIENTCETNPKHNETTW